MKWRKYSVCKTKYNSSINKMINESKYMMQCNEISVGICENRKIQLRNMTINSLNWNSLLIYCIKLYFTKRTESDKYV